MESIENPGDAGAGRNSVSRAKGTSRRQSAEEDAEIQRWFQLADQVAASLPSPTSRITCRSVLHQFVAWYQTYPKREIQKKVVSDYIQHLMDRGLATGSINLRLSALRKLISAAAAAGMTASEGAAKATKVRGLNPEFVREAIIRRRTAPSVAGQILRAAKRREEEKLLRTDADADAEEPPVFRRRGMAYGGGPAPENEDAQRFWRLAREVSDTLPSTAIRSSCRSSLRQFLAWYYGPPQKKIDRNVMAEYAQHMIKRGLAPGTIDGKLYFVRKMIREAGAKGLVPQNAAAEATRVKSLRRPSSGRR